jgi:hypothetical protein
MVCLPAILGKTFVIKAHSEPTTYSRLLRCFGLLRITYIYRDPRDAMLSAYDYGLRALQKGHPNAFSHLTNFDAALDFMMVYVRIWEKWMREKNILTARYEDLLLNYDIESNSLAEFLRLDPHDPRVMKVLEEYRPGRSEGQTGLHFYKGKIGRFRQVYDLKQQAIMRDRLGLVLNRMGYTV